MTDHLAERLDALVGTTWRYVAPEPFGRAAIRQYALAVGANHPVHHDDAAARTHGYETAVAPWTFVCDTNQYARGPIPDDGYIGHVVERPDTAVPVRRGGNSYEFGRPVVAGDRMVSTWEVRQVRQKVTSRGDPLVVVTSLNTLSDVSGDFLASNEETMLFLPEER